MIRRMFLLILSLTVSASVFAASKKAKKAKDRVSTDVSFEGQTVHGRYQSADEAVAIVEDDKVLNDLLDVRTHFKDRLKKNMSRR